MHSVHIHAHVHSVSIERDKDPGRVLILYSFNTSPCKIL
jgi:hypothetical protein